MRPVAGAAPRAMGRAAPRGEMKMSHAPFGALSHQAPFGVDDRRDPARERLAQVLSDASAREHTRARFRLSCRSRQAGGGRA
jgi:hypothetical protein